MQGTADLDRFTEMEKIFRELQGETGWKCGGGDLRRVNPQVLASDGKYGGLNQRAAIRSVQEERT
jgi:hypothetical protein